MKERLNLKNITLNETADELAYKGIKEARSFRGYSNWEFGKGYKKPFNKFLEYTSEVDKRTDTNHYIENLNLKGNNHKLQEGAGAGYDLKLFGICVDNVVLTKVYKNDIGVQTADFEAEIVPGSYDWRAEGYDWSVDSTNFNEYDDFEFDVDKAYLGGKVWGTWENPIQNFQDENAEDYSEDKIKNEIRGESFDLGDSLSWGWVHSDIPAKWDIEEEVGRKDHYDKAIDISDSSDRYKFSYISKASIKFPEVDLMNDYVNQAMYPEDYFGDAEEEADTYEDYLDYAGRTNGTPMSKEEWENVTGIKEDPQLELPFGESKIREDIKNAVKNPELKKGYKDISYRKRSFNPFIKEGSGWRAIAEVGISFGSIEDKVKAQRVLSHDPDENIAYGVSNLNSDFIQADNLEFRPMANVSSEGRGLVIQVPIVRDATVEIPDYLDIIQKKLPVTFSKEVCYNIERSKLEDFDNIYNYEDVKSDPSMTQIRIANEKGINESNKKRVKEFYTPSPNKEKYWKDPNHPQARAERDWWLHRVRTSKNNIWENDGAFDFADHDAKESLRKFGKIYVDPETGKPVEPNYVRNLIDEWGDKE